MKVSKYCMSLISAEWVLGLVEVTMQAMGKTNATVDDARRVG